MPVAFSGTPDRNTLLTPMEEELVAEINRVRTDPPVTLPFSLPRDRFTAGGELWHPPKQTKISK